MSGSDITQEELAQAKKALGAHATPPMIAGWVNAQRKKDSPGLGTILDELFKKAK